MRTGPRARLTHWPLATLLIASLALLAGCGDAAVDDGANRSAEKAEVLRDRLSTTQADR